MAMNAIRLSAAGQRYAGHLLGILKDAKGFTVLVILLDTGKIAEVRADEVGPY